MNTAIIGLGHMGLNHLKTIEKYHLAEIAGVVDENLSRASAVGQEFNLPYFTNLEDLIKSKKLGSVIIATPTKTHFRLASFFIRQKIPTLIEKPLSANYKKSCELVSLARKKGLAVLAGHTERFNPAILALKENLKLLGKIYLVQVQRLSPKPFYIKDTGVILDLATHDLDIFLYLFQKNLELKSAIVRKFDPKSRYEDYVSAFFQTKNDITIHLESSWLSPIKIRTLKITGENGILVLDFQTQEILFFRTLDNLEKLSRSQKSIPFNVEKLDIFMEEPLKIELTNFFEYAKGKIDLSKYLDDANEVVRVGEELLRYPQKFSR